LKNHDLGAGTGTDFDAFKSWPFDGQALSDVVPSGSMEEKDRLSTSALTPGRLAWLLVTYRAELLQRWTLRVLEDPAVPVANRLSKPALEDHVPELLDRLLKRLARHPTEPWGERVGREVGGSGLGVAHAQQRIALHYTLPEALRELSLFRVTVLALCAEHEIALSLDETELFHATIDEMMTASASELERISRRMYEQLMAVVAHDLRNPLNAITLQAALLRNGPLDPEKASDTLARNAKHMERLIGDLLTFSKLQAGHFSIEAADVDAREIVRHSCELFQPTAKQRAIELAAVVPEQNVVLRCDRDRIVQALANVVGNAVKFTPDGGRVCIELEGDGSECRFRVRDTGPGIAPEHIEDVFRPFWQEDAHKAGTGLGLAIARGIVEAHGGEIGVERAGPGATFVFSIPYGAVLSASASLPVPGPGMPHH
jgi:signal transduction histidine kinase